MVENKNFFLFNKRGCQTPCKQGDANRKDAIKLPKESERKSIFEHKHLKYMGKT